MMYRAQPTMRVFGAILAGLGILSIGRLVATSRSSAAGIKRTRLPPPGVVCLSEFGGAGSGLMGAD